MNIMNPYSSGLLRRPSEYALQHALPLEIVHLILEYAGKMKNRNGKYMNQITPKDKRYYMLLRMPRIEPTVIGGWRITIKSMNFYGDRKSVYFNKFVRPYSGEEPLITAKTSERASYFNFTHQGYCYNWTTYKSVKISLK